MVNTLLWLALLLRVLQRTGKPYENMDLVVLLIMIAALTMQTISIFTR